MSTLQKLPLEAIMNKWGNSLDDTTRGTLIDLLTLLREREQNLDAILNQGINFADNFNGNIISYTTNAAPDTQDAQNHGLRRAPTFFLVIDQDKGGVLYRSATFDNTKVYFKCSVASMTVNVLIF